MNKQAFAFLTLFTLILMLSIYYVTMPADLNQINPDQILTTGPDDNDDSLGVLQDGLNEKYLQEKQNSQAVLSSPDASSKEKQDALQEVGKIENTQQVEKNVVGALEENGLKGCLVELNDQVVRIACPKDLKSVENASKAMKIVAGLVEEDCVPEVSFQ